LEEIGFTNEKLYWRLKKKRETLKKIGRRGQRFGDSYILRKGEKK